MLKLEQGNVTVNVFYNDNCIGYAPLFREKNQIVRSIYYLLGNYAPHLSKDTIEAELERLDKFKV